jgi:hypothetical protein
MDSAVGSSWIVQLTAWSEVKLPGTWMGEGVCRVAKYVLTLYKIHHIIRPIIMYYMPNSTYLYVCIWAFDTFWHNPRDMYVFLALS